MTMKTVLKMEEQQNTTKHNKSPKTQLILLETTLGNYGKKRRVIN